MKAFIAYQLNLNVRIMNTLLLLLILSASMTSSYDKSDSCDEGDTVSLRDFTWKNRVIILNAENQNQDLYQSQVNSFSSLESHIQDRDLVIISLFREGCSTLNGNKISGESADNIRRNLQINDGEYSVLLIGKDGGVKFRKNEIVEPVELFSVIDRMPMRQREMRNGF